jgi:hypothetical protein
MKPNEFDLSQASRVYGVANTPPFLVRKLQTDPALLAMGENCGPEEIMSALRAAVAAEPATSVDAVRPYALLVALWFKPEIEHLKEAAKIQAPEYRWYSYVAELLIQSFSPTQRQSVQVPGVLSAPAVSLESSASVSTAPTIIIAHR